MGLLGQIDEWYNWYYYYLVVIAVIKKSKIMTIYLLIILFELRKKERKKDDKFCFYLRFVTKRNFLFNIVRDIFISFLFQIT